MMQLENGKGTPAIGVPHTKKHLPDHMVPDITPSINSLPQTWALTPVNSRKAPYRDDWQIESPLTLNAIAAELQSGRAKGVGVRLGPVSGGLLAVDVDGDAAHDLLLKLGALPDTATITSGWHPHRYCHFLMVPDQYWDAIQTRKLKTGVKEPNWEGKPKPADVELRWDGTQQVIAGQHPSGNQYQWVRHPNQGIAIAPDWLIEKMLKETPVPTKPAPRESKHRPSGVSRREWTDVEWAREYLAAIDPTKADVYGDWLAVGMALKGVSDSLKQDWVEWSQQSPAYDGKHLDDWDRATFKADPYGLAKLGQWAKENGWVGNGYSGNGNSNGRIKTVANLEDFTMVATTGVDTNAKQETRSLTTIVNDLINSSKDGAQLQEPILVIASNSGRTSNEIWKLYHTRLEEIERQEDQPQIRAEVERMVAAKSESISLESCLPKPLSDAIYERAALMNDSPESMLLSLLAGLSSLQNPGTRLRISKGFAVTPGIWVCLHGETGSMKTPIMKLMALDPLNRLASNAKIDHDEAVKDWRKRKDAAKKNDEEFSDEYPQRHDIIATTGTYEGCLKSLRFGRGLLYSQDELTAFYEYAMRNGRMGEVLSLWNGDALHKKLAGKTADDGSEIGRYLDVESTLFPVLGGIQPGILESFIGKGDDNGFWARFLFCHVKRCRKQFDFNLDDLDDPSDNPNSLEGVLRQLYEHAKEIGGNPAICRLSPSATQRYAAYIAALDDRLDSEALPTALRGSIDKVAGYVGRVALTLQFIWDCWQGRFALTPIIEDWCMAAAIAVMRFHLAQAELIYAENHAGGTQSIPWEIQKILEVSQGKPINATAIKATCSYFRQKKAAEIKILFEQAVAMGLGTMSGKGRLAKFCPCEIQTNQLNHSQTTNKPLSNQLMDSQDYDISTDSSSYGLQTNQTNQTNGGGNGIPPIPPPPTPMGSPPPIPIGVEIGGQDENGMIPPEELSHQDRGNHHDW